MVEYRDDWKPGMKKSLIHVFPFRGGHKLTGTDCWCMPKVERGEYADIVIHNQFAAGVKPPKKEN
jgi:hypothetical protein